VSDLFTVRRATLTDVGTIAQHRVAMFRDMGELDERSADALHEATVSFLNRMIPTGEYAGWLACAAGRAAEVVGGAGVQVRTLLPRPLADGRMLRVGPEAIVVNVYTDPTWRRRGVARTLMEHLIAWAREREVGRLVLHASKDGRALYEQLGFEPTNEMRFTGDLKPP
jgi:GNAT superfamily N-acetyltransferase